MPFQGQDHHCLELDTRGGQLWPSQKVLDWSLTFRPGHCDFLRWPVCPVRYYTDQFAHDRATPDETRASNRCLSSLPHAGSWDGTLRLWDLNSGNTTRRFIGHSKDVLSVAFSVDNRQVLLLDLYDSLHQTIKFAAAAFASPCNKCYSQP